MKNAKLPRDYKAIIFQYGNKYASSFVATMHIIGDTRMRIDFCKWSNLQKLAQGPAVRLTALVPFLGTMIVVGSQYLDKSYGINLLKNDYEGSYKFIHFLFDANIVSTILNMYYGFTLTGFGYLIYSWICPHPIKDFSSISTYISGTAPFDTPKSILEISEKIPNNLLADIADLDATTNPKNFDHSISLRSGVQLPRDEWARNNSTNIIEIKRIYYNYIDISNYFIRFLTFMLFTMGFILASIPAVKTLVRITNTFII